MANNPYRIALVGAGMFGGDVHARTYADLQIGGISSSLLRLGLDRAGRELGSVTFELTAVATRSEASAVRVAAAYQELTGSRPATYFGETPWVELLADHRDIDMVAVATPDHLHTPVILAALEAGADVVTEKPMCLDMGEADTIVDKARATGRVVCVDMHKRFDPDHLRIRDELAETIGPPLYGLAVLEEPLEVSTSTFAWVEDSDPFSYVGPHWVDLFYHYYGAKPASLTAVGQKKRLRRDGIDAYDSVQVRVDYDNGMSVTYHNNWVTPGDFEGPVNQHHEIVGADGKVESDQQYRGLRFWSAGGGSRTANNHFTRDVKRPHGPPAYVGYGVDGIVAGVAASCRVRRFGDSVADVAGWYPTAEEGRITTAVVHAAREVCDRNFRYLEEGRGAPVTARFGKDGIVIVDPCAGETDPNALFERIYDRPL